MTDMKDAKKPYVQGDAVELKKGHPCGANDWTILRTGVDMRLRCNGCGHEIWVKRRAFEKHLRKVLRRHSAVEREEMK